jgi:hypothetical protein
MAFEAWHRHINDQDIGHLLFEGAQSNLTI